jgi:predicted anti-sigma-YlaC factor YlaD
MNCRYVQSRLSAYLDFELSGDEQQLIRSHLEECIECSCEFESLRRTKQLLRQMPIVKPRTGPEQVLFARASGAACYAASCVGNSMASAARVAIRRRVRAGGGNLLLGTRQRHRTLDRDHRQPHTKLFHPRL